MNKLPTFVLASGNAHKLKELRCMLEIDETQLKSAKDFPEIPEPIEDADSFIMGWVRYIHFFAAFLFTLNLAVRLYWVFTGNKYATSNILR